METQEIKNIKSIMDHTNLKRKSIGSLGDRFKKYEPKQVSETKITSWQDYAINVCTDFAIQGRYKGIIFKHAKNNMCYLQGKVELCYEKWGKEGCKSKGRYLVALFRKTPPWIKK